MLSLMDQRSLQSAYLSSLAALVQIKSVFIWLQIPQISQLSAQKWHALLQSNTDIMERFSAQTSRNSDL